MDPIRNELFPTVDMLYLSANHKSKMLKIVFGCRKKIVIYLHLKPIILLYDLPLFSTSRVTARHNYI